MKRFNVVFLKSAAKEFRHLPGSVRDKVLEAVELLAINPYSAILPVKKLRGGEDLYRLRLGDYRLIYQVESRLVKVVIIKIGHRRDVYRLLG